MTHTIMAAVYMLLVVADFITGTAAAIKNKQYKSSIAKEHGIKKVAIVLGVFALSLAQDHGLQIPATEFSVSYLSTAEIGSLWENFKKLKESK